LDKKSKKKRDPTRRGRVEQTPIGHQGWWWVGGHRGKSRKIRGGRGEGKHRKKLYLKRKRLAIPQNKEKKKKKNKWTKTKKKKIFGPQGKEKGSKEKGGMTHLT